MHLAVAGAASICVLGVVIALLWLPGRNAVAQTAPSARTAEGTAEGTAVPEPAGTVAPESGF